MQNAWLLRSNEVQERSLIHLFYYHAMSIALGICSVLVSWGPVLVFIPVFLALFF